MVVGIAGRVEPIDIVIVDKSPLVVEGLRELFGKDNRIGRVDSARRVDQFLELLADASFDVAVVGWVLEESSGRDLLLSLEGDATGPRVVVYTGDPDPGIPRKVMSLGGAGFCSKTESPERLVDIVVEVRRGLMVFPFLDVRRLHDDRLTALTARELAFVGALADGHSNKSLAAEFGVSVNTVKFHLSNAYVKLDVRNRAQAVAVFLQPGGR